MQKRTAREGERREVGKEAESFWFSGWKRSFRSQVLMLMSVPISIVDLIRCLV